MATPLGVRAFLPNLKLLTFENGAKRSKIWKSALNSSKIHKMEISV
jgi:hypothetical protein